jgi:hypothetical protein
VQIWNLEQSGMRYDYSEGMMASISIEMSLDKKIVNRSVYSFSSWLNEIGGYGQTIAFICSLLLPLI